MSVYQPTFNVLELKNDKGTEYIISWNSKGIYRIAFDGKGSQTFNDNFARNVIIFGVDNSSSSHTNNLKNDFLILGERKYFLY